MKSSFLSNFCLIPFFGKTLIDALTPEDRFSHVAAKLMVHVFWKYTYMYENIRRLYFCVLVEQMHDIGSEKLRKSALSLRTKCQRMS